MDFFDGTEREGFLSRTFVTFINNIIHMGKKKKDQKKEITLEDVPPLNENYSSQNNYQKFYKYYKGSLLPALIQAIGWPFYGASLLKLIEVIIFIVEAKIGKWLIHYIESGDENWMEGIYIVLAIGTNYFTKRIVEQWSNHLTTSSVLQSQTMLSAAIVEKTLRLDSLEVENQGQGKILNLLEKQQRSFTFVGLINNTWSEILTLIIVLRLLWNEVGFLFLLGIILSIISFYINILIFRKTKENNEKLDNYHKNLTKYINQFVKGVKAIKLNLWEDYASGVSQKEFENIKYCEKKRQFLNQTDSIQKDFFTNAIIIISIVSILIKDGAFTATQVYTISRLFWEIRYSLFSLSERYSNFAMMMVYVRKFESFLSLRERKPLPSTGNAVGEVMLSQVSISCLEDNSESQQEDAEKQYNLRQVLHDVNLHIQPGEIVGIAGPVGSGKSLLLKALINESCIEGKIQTKGSIMYLPHDPWIINETLKKNILMDNEYDSEKYQRVIKMCQLNEDISFLPNGDQTEIGSRGINLSGGQRQRVAIARAVYSNSDIYLFDDRDCRS